MPTDAAPRWSLQRRISLGLLSFSLILTVVVLGYGYLVHESAEQVVWRSLLEAELDHLLQRSARDPSYQWQDTQALRLYRERHGELPQALRTLDDGLHDEVWIGPREYVVFIREHAGERYYLALDIMPLEANERRIGLGVVAAAVLAVGLLAVLVGYGVRRLVAPLTRLVEAIGQLHPQRGGPLLADDPDDSRELALIRAALNDYIQRNQTFVERERAFVDLASHELRTPIAVIRGAAELAVHRDTAPAQRSAALQRLQHTAEDVETLINLLLLLAKDPARLRAGAESVDLDALLRRIADDHRYLCQGKALQLRLDLAPAPPVNAPPGLLQAAIGNLLRNAIENSDSGEILIRLRGCEVGIADPGHGMSPEQISQLYSQRLRAGSRSGEGIGLDLIARLCKHLGWSLRFQPQLPQGTLAVLDLSAAAPQSSP